MQNGRTSIISLLALPPPPPVNSSDFFSSHSGIHSSRIGEKLKQKTTFFAGGGQEGTSINQYLRAWTNKFSVFFWGGGGKKIQGILRCKFPFLHWMKDIGFLFNSEMGPSYPPIPSLFSTALLFHPSPIETCSRLFYACERGIWVFFVCEGRGGEGKRTQTVPSPAIAFSIFSLSLSLYLHLPHPSPILALVPCWEGRKPLSSTSKTTWRRSVCNNRLTSQHCCHFFSLLDTHDNTRVSPLPLPLPPPKRRDRPEICVWTYHAFQHSYTHHVLLVVMEAYRICSAGKDIVFVQFIAH